MVDLDEFFAYETIALIRIRDRRLGMLHYAFMFAVVLYVIVGTILVGKRYTLLEAPLGSVRVSLQQPSTPLAPNLLPYCYIPGQPTTYTYNGFNNFNCLYWDQYFVLYPIIEERSMSVTTRVTIMQQSKNTSLLDPTVKYNTTSSNDYYIADIEHFTILIDHTMLAPTLGIQTNARNISGRFISSNGSEIHSFPNNVIGEPGQSDIVELKTLIDAAGLYSLDQQSTAFSTSSRSMRSDGIVLIVFIEYSNTFTYNLNNFRYTYKVVRIADTKYKSEAPEAFDITFNDRMILDRHSVRIIFIQSGELGKFDFQTLLLSFIQGLGLMAVAGTIVDQISLKVLPQKEIYNSYKYKKTKEFKEIKRLTLSGKGVPLEQLDKPTEASPI